MYSFWYLYNFGYGKLLSISIVLGFLYSAFRYRYQTILIGSIIIPYFFLFAVISGTAPVRNFAAVTPILLILPSILMYDVISRTFKTRYKNLLLCGIVVLIGFTSFKNSFLSSLYSSKPLNYSNYFSWINQHIKEGAIVAKTPGAFMEKDHTGIQIIGSYTGEGISLEELKRQGVEYVLIASYHTTLSNMLVWTGRIDEDLSFYTEKKKWDLVNNTYLTLALKELGRYSAAQFFKPYWQSLEPTLLVAEIPNFWKPRKDKAITSYHFATDEEVNKFLLQLPLTKTQPTVHRERDGESLTITTPLDTCTDQMKITSPFFAITADTWHTATGRIKSEPGEKNPASSAFLRLDFYDEEKKLLTTSVSSLLKEDSSWHELTAASFTPKNALFATISIQFDQCVEDSKYSIDYLEAYSSEEVAASILSKYHYYKKVLPKNFIWVPEIL